MRNIDHFMSTIGQLISATRAASMDQNELAIRAGLSRRAISNIENGKNCNIASLLKVLEQLNLLDDFQKVVDDNLALSNTRLQRKSRNSSGKLSNHT